MTEQIKYQKNLMEYALLILDQSEHETYEPHKKALQKEYAETMATLAGELAKLAKVNPITHEEIQY